MKKLCLPFFLAVVSVATIGCGQSSSLDRVGSERRRIAAPPPSPPPPEVTAAFNVQFLDGQSIAFDKMVGQGDVVVMNFWATWCGPCKREIPELKGLDREFAGRNVRIIGLSVEDANTDAELVKAFAGQYSIGYKVGFVTDDMFEAFTGAGNRPVVPQTFVFDKQGKMILHLRGMHPQFRDMVRDSIDAAL